MNIFFDANQPVVVQHNATGSSVFNPTDAANAGRAYATLGAAGAAITYRACEYGLAGNSLEVAQINPGAKGNLRLEVVGSLIRVYLKHNGSAITSTADEVAAAVNAAGLPVLASAAGTSTVTAVASTALAHGGDPTVFKRQRYVWTPVTAGDPMGLIHFNQEAPFKVHQIELKLAVSAAFTFALVNLDDGGSLISGDSVVIYGATSANGFFATPFCLSPRQAIAITAAQQGIARVVASRFTP